MDLLERVGEAAEREATHYAAVVAVVAAAVVVGPVQKEGSREVGALAWSNFHSITSSSGYDLDGTKTLTESTLAIPTPCGTQGWSRHYHFVAGARLGSAK